MYVKINVLYVHCTAYILHILDLAHALVFNAAQSTRELFLFSTLIDKSPLTSNISQLLKTKEKSGLPYPHNRTFWFLVNIHIYIYIYIYICDASFLICVLSNANFNVLYLSLGK